MRALILLTIGLCLIGAPVAAQDAPPCRGRHDLPYVWEVGLCPEMILEGFGAHGDLAAISSLVFTPEGALYFTSPARRAVYRLLPDSEGFFGAPELVATLAESPFGIAYAADEAAFYVAAEQSLFRIAADGSVALLYRDSATRWHGELHIGADGKLYVARNTAEGAALISLARDGSDVRILAEGLSQIFDFTWQGEALIIADAAESALYTLRAGALTRLAELPAHSTPHGILFYTGSMAQWHDGVFVALSGSWNATTVSGYAVYWLNPAQPSVHQQVIPSYYGLDAEALARRRVSFHPLQLMGIAVDANGWLYTALAEGYIYRFRPR
ncbi:MAG: hypothetical protein CUN51_05885 [Candidatus Thermofonsia Clade 1 bacterium]|uniref:SMP-30/Gluconolactonase/LRE-like region domain-containing protein n=1 Tax=Candidatus Thermofonsia Clade 1 bacterium TaxID=2364210 RepID=A0A2M8P0D7_9CHLR|nr:MAG: hypothetical protein CUN51_05885 [Candidatus Thermofonsia Clade 1 bacterium]